MSVDMSNMAANMGSVGGQPMPAGAAEMFKDVKMVMTGSLWVAKEGPGVAEYTEFSRAAMKSMQGGVSPFGGPMAGMPGMEEMLKAFSQLEGMAVLSEIEMAFEGNNPMVEMMKAMGPMKITSKLSDISTAPLADDVFQVPADYTVSKKEQ